MDGRRSSGPGVTYALSIEGVDRLIKALDEAFRRVEASKGSKVRLPSAELDLLVILEQARDVVNTALTSGSRDILKEVFGGTCERTAKIRAVLDACELSEMNAGDQRLETCRSACDSVERVLKDLGLGEALSDAQKAEKDALVKAREQAESTPASSVVEAVPAATAGEGETPAATASTQEAASGSHGAPATTTTLTPEVCPPEADNPSFLPPEFLTTARPLCHAGGVPLCKIGCGRQVAPGVTRRGKPFDTCCRGCAVGQDHSKLCGMIDPEKVGPGLCKMGCGLPCAAGRDSSGTPLDTCCRGCVRGEGHDSLCGQDVGDQHIPYAAIEGRVFVQAKQDLTPVQYNELVEEIRLLNRRQQPVEQCLERLRAIIGRDRPELLSGFERLLSTPK